MVTNRNCYLLGGGFSRFSVNSSVDVISGIPLPMSRSSASRVNTVMVMRRLEGARGLLGSSKSLAARPTTRPSLASGMPAETSSRREALARFARAQAEGVLEDQTQRALEPMGAADRKVIHDTVNDIDGVGTVSEGEDPKRRVVLVPDSD